MKPAPKVPPGSDHSMPDDLNIPDSPSFQGLALPLLLLTAIFFLNFLSRIILGPVLPKVENDLGLSHSAAGSLFLFVSIGYSIMLLASGVISAHLGHRRSVTLSIASVGVALLILTLVQDVGAMRFNLTLLGLAAGLYLPSALVQLTALSDQVDWGKMIAVHEIAPNLATIAAPMLSVTLLPVIGWRGIVGLIGAAALLAAGANTRLVRIPKSTDVSTLDFSFIRQIVASRSLWVMVALFGLGIGSNIGILSMLPLYLVSEVGYSQAESDQILAWTRLATPALVFLSGGVADRIGRERTLGVALVLSGVMIALIGVVSGPQLVALLFIQPLAAVSFFPSAFAVLSSRGDGQTRNLMVSLTIPLASLLGTGLVPSLIGWAGDIGRIGWGISAFGLMVLVGGTIYVLGHAWKRG